MENEFFFLVGIEVLSLVEIKILRFRFSCLARLEAASDRAPTSASLEALFGEMATRWIRRRPGC
jgi:hypothetical protein